MRRSAGAAGNAPTAIVTIAVGASFLTPGLDTVCTRAYITYRQRKQSLKTLRAMNNFVPKTDDPTNHWPALEQFVSDLDASDDVTGGLSWETKLNELEFLLRQSGATEVNRFDLMHDLECILTEDMGLSEEACPDPSTRRLFLLERFV